MFEKIQAYLASQLDIPADEITRDTTFESLGVDSLDTVEMVMDLEEQLGVDLELEEKIAYFNQLLSSDELLRKVEAAQFVATHDGEVCPAKWKKGAETLKPSIDLVGKI
mgnify:CR=1 FL=1